MMDYKIIIFICCAVSMPALSAGRVPRDDKIIFIEDEIKKTIPECRPKPDVPNFAKPGKRVNEVKCMEYAGSLKNARNCHKKALKKQGKKANDSGSRYSTGEFPHMAVLGWKTDNGSWTFKCAGALISDKFVVTAAHCTKYIHGEHTVTDRAPKIVRFGENNLFDQDTSGKPPVDAVIKRIILHPEYKAPKKYNDLALIELENPVDLDYLVHPACLWGSQVNSSLGKRVVETSWTWGTDYSDLSIVEFDLVETNECDNLLKPHCSRIFCELQDGQICAKTRNTVDNTLRQIGGALQKKITSKDLAEPMHYVIGVAVFGVTGAAARPDVFTRISHYIGWIEQVVWGGQPF